MSPFLKVAANCSACSTVSHPLVVSVRTPYCHTACAKAFKSTQPEEAVLSFAHIVQAILFSVAKACHTACANHCGESSVNGVIIPVIWPRAVISASAVILINDSHVEKAIAHNVPIPVNITVELPVQ